MIEFALIRALRTSYSSTLPLVTTLDGDTSRMFSNPNMGFLHVCDLSSYYHVQAEAIYVIVVIHLNEQQNMVVELTCCASSVHI
jgi:hypothetical protein